MSRNKHVKTLQAMIGKYCDDFETQDNRKNSHLRFVLWHNGKKHTVFTSSTPSDFRATKNFESEVKRAMQRLKGELDA